MADTGTAVARADLAADAVAALAAEVTGPVLGRGDDGYDAERGGAFNLNLVAEPDLVVGAASAADVRAAVRFAVAHGRPIAVLGGGHGNVRPGPDSVLLTTRRMAGVTVRPDEQVARVEAGARWADVLAAGTPLGLAPPLGSYPAVGAVSYAVGGGLSPFLGRSVGWAVDRIRALEMVTAGGELRTLSPDREPELFWAARGTRGNLGVVTAMEIDLFPVTRLYGGALTFPAARIPEVLHAWARWVPALPEELSTSVALIRFPDLPMVPEHLRGTVSLALRVAYLGDAAEGERLVAPMRALGPTLGDTLAEMPYADVKSIHADPDRPSPAHDASVQLTGLTAETVDALLGAAGPDSGARLTVVELRLLGGALNRPAAVPSSFELRDGAFQLALLAIGGPAAAEPFEQAVRRTYAAIEPWSVGHASLGYLAGRDAVRPDVVRGAYRPETWRRLTELKARYDPANTFRDNANIPPAGRNQVAGR